jgi:hypothetical protein
LIQPAINREIPATQAQLKDAHDRYANIEINYLLQHP